MKIPKAFFPLYLFPFVRYCHHIITGPVWLVLSHFFRFEGVIKYTKSTFWGNKNISRLQSQTACLRKKNYGPRCLRLKSTAFVRFFFVFFYENFSQSCQNGNHIYKSLSVLLDFFLPNLVKKNGSQLILPKYVSQKGRREVNKNSFFYYGQGFSYPGNPKSFVFLFQSSNIKSK